MEMIMRKKARYVVDDDDDDDSGSDDVIADGDHVHVPLHVCDSAQSRNAPVVRAAVVDANDHRPHYAQMSDAQHLRRTLARDEMIRTASEAWRMAGRDQKPPDDPDEDDPNNGDDDDTNDSNRATRAYRDMVARNSRAWKVPRGVGPGSVGAGPSNPYVGTGDSSNRRLLTRDEAQSMKDAAYQKHVHDLENAWRGGK
jgi:hypothetical protein